MPPLVFPTLSVFFVVGLGPEANSIPHQQLMRGTSGLFSGRWSKVVFIQLGALFLVVSVLRDCTCIATNLILFY